MTSTGTILVVLRSPSDRPGSPPFTDILGAQPPVRLASLGAAHTYNAGLQWPELTNDNLNQAVSITYTASCNEGAPSTVAFFSAARRRGVNVGDTLVTGSGFTRRPTFHDHGCTYGTPRCDSLLTNWYPEPTPMLPATSLLALGRTTALTTTTSFSTAPKR